MSRQAPRTLAPEAIWGQFNNYRSNGLVGSVVAHIIILGLILSVATFGHDVVKQVKHHETVMLIAPSPETYALPIAKKLSAVVVAAAITTGCLRPREPSQNPLWNRSLPRDCCS